MMSFVILSGKEQKGFVFEYIFSEMNSECYNLLILPTIIMHMIYKKQICICRGMGPK